MPFHMRGAKERSRARAKSSCAYAVPGQAAPVELEPQCFTAGAAAMLPAFRVLGFEPAAALRCDG
jgi:hypothetical protein